MSRTESLARWMHSVHSQLLQEKGMGEWVETWDQIGKLPRASYMRVARELIENPPREVREAIASGVLGGAR